MKQNKTTWIVVIVIFALAAVGAMVFLNRASTKEEPQETVQSSKKEPIPAPEIPAESLVTVPEPDFTDIETLATYNIPTKAAAGSQSRAIFIEYSNSQAKGYLTYEADPDNPASFTVVKNSEGKWELTDYVIYGETDL